MTSTASDPINLEELITTEDTICFSQCDDSFFSSKSNNEVEEYNSSKTATHVKGYTCVICGLVKEGISLHRFPADAKIRSQWAAFCNVDVKLVKHWQGLCDEHFVEDDFLSNVSYLTKRKLLKKNRVPSRNRPKRPDELLSEEYTYEIFVDGFGNDVDMECEANIKAEAINVKSATVSTTDTHPEVSQTATNEKSNRMPLICKRKFPRYFMDIKSQDVSSPKYAKLCLEMGQQTILKYRRKINTLQHENKRLQKKLLNSQEVFLLLKNNAISMDEAVKMIDRRNIFNFPNKNALVNREE